MVTTEIPELIFLLILYFNGLSYSVFKDTLKAYFW